VVVVVVVVVVEVSPEFLPSSLGSVSEEVLPSSSGVEDVLPSLPSDDMLSF